MLWWLLHRLVRLFSYSFELYDELTSLSVPCSSCLWYSLLEVLHMKWDNSLSHNHVIGMNKPCHQHILHCLFYCCKCTPAAGGHCLTSHELNICSQPCFWWWCSNHGALEVVKKHVLVLSEFVRNACPSAPSFRVSSMLDLETWKAFQSFIRPHCLEREKDNNAPVRRDLLVIDHGERRL